VSFQPEPTAGRDRGGMDHVGKVVPGWLSEGHRATLCRVARRAGFGSVPNGELLAINDAGATVGTMLGGSGDRLLHDVSADMFKGADPRAARTVEADVHGAAVVAAGLACGGHATLVVQLADRIPAAFWGELANHRPVTLTTVVTEDEPSVVRSRVYLDQRPPDGTTGKAALDEHTDELSRQLLAAGESAVQVIDADGQAVLVEAFIPSPRLVIVGSGDLAEAITAQAELLGWGSRVAADTASATDALQWAGPSAALIVLSHDPHVDALVMASAFSHDVDYVGALGSHRTQLRRSERLRALGVSDDDIARIRGPIGLDLGGRQPSHVALAVCAEILTSRTGRSARPLAERLVRDPTPAAGG
jgi:xanthine dehydrogenase accessory factor